MRKLVRRLAPIAAMALMPLAAVTIAMPAASSAEPLNCDPGQWWDPTGMYAGRWARGRNR